MWKIAAVWFAALALLPGPALAAEEPYFGHVLPGMHAFAVTAGARTETSGSRVRDLKNRRSAR